MATGTPETLNTRQEALHLLERGRAELSAEARWLRERVSPKAALKRGMENNPALLLGGGLALGLVATLLLFRRRRHHAAPQHHHFSRAREVYAPAPRASLGGQLVSQVAHMVLPLVVLPMVEKFVKQGLQRKQETAHRT